jgi:hypothetical protein
MKQTSVQVGVTHVAGDGVRGERQLGTVVGEVGWGSLPWRRGAVFVIGGMLPGMLLRVHLECICLVNFRMRFVWGSALP